MIEKLESDDSFSIELNSTNGQWTMDNDFQIVEKPSHPMQPMRRSRWDLEPMIGETYICAWASGNRSKPLEGKIDCHLVFMQ